MHIWRRVTFYGLLLGSGLLLGFGLVAPSTNANSADDPVIVAAGDICKGTSTNCAPTASLIDAINPMWVLPLGDNAYEEGSLSQYNSLYAPNWGRFKAKTKPVIGNHEYLTANGQGYKDYFGPAFAKTYYSYDVGAWHMIALDSNCSKVGGCQVGSPQETWLKADLALHPAACVLAYWHHPRFSSGDHGNNTTTLPLWNALYAARADIVLNGHDHIYERFNKQTPSGSVDTVNGIREFVVGTGGANHVAFGSIKPNSQVRNATTFGVLKLTLHPGSYDFKFQPVAGSTFTDSGTTACSGGAIEPPPTTTVGTTTAPPPPTTTTVPPPPLSNVSLPARATFFYPWFPEAWNQQGFNPFTMFHPSDGYYNSSNPVQIEKQINAMDYGNFKVAISSWWGQGHPTDVRFPTLLDETGEIGSPLKWATYYEKESTGDPTVRQLRADLTYLRDNYAGENSYARVGGKFVVFVFEDPNDGCAMADRWKQANTVGAYIVLKVFAGYRTCLSQPNGWHQYAPAVPTDSQAGYSYAISPGFNKPGEAGPRLARDLTRFKSNIASMNAAAVPWKLVTTFSEWGEGSPVESATEWASPSGFGTYLDALHDAP